MDRRTLCSRLVALNNRRLTYFILAPDQRCTGSEEPSGCRFVVETALLPEGFNESVPCHGIERRRNAIS